MEPFLHPYPIFPELLNDDDDDTYDLFALFLECFMAFSGSVRQSFGVSIVQVGRDKIEL